MEIGDIVYYVECTSPSGAWEVRWGVVDTVYPTEVELRLYSIRNRLRFNGVSLLDWLPDSVDVFRKLPKGWTWHTELVGLTEDDSYDSAFEGASFDDPESLMRLIRQKVLIPNERNEFRHPVAEVQKDGTYYLRWSNDYENPGQRRQSYERVLKDKVFRSYEDANAWIADRVAEQRRIADMDDTEWVAMMVDKTIARWADMVNVRLDDPVCKHARNYLLGRKRVDTVCVRVARGEKGIPWIQWRYNDPRDDWRWVPVE